MDTAKITFEDEKVVLETERLFLRAAQASDAEALHSVFADPETMRYWSERPHPGIARTKAWMAGMIASAQNGLTDFILCSKPHPSASMSEAIPIGKAGVYQARPSNEIGFLVARTHWRKGLAREVLTRLLDYLFALERPACNSESDEQIQRPETEEKEAPQLTRLDLSELDSRWAYPSITADVDPRNVASVGILEVMGFVTTGFAEKSYRVADEWQDSQYFRVTRDAWILQRALTAPK